MRRLACAALALVATAAVVAASTGTASAENRRPAQPRETGHAHVDHAKPTVAKPRHPRHPVVVTMTGWVTDTATAVVTPAPSDTATVGTSDSTPAVDPVSPVADTATSTVRIAVKGGERSLHVTMVVLTLDKNTVVRRGDSPATAADLRPGDHVSVRARLLPDGGWLALRVNAAPRRSDR